MHRIHSPHPSIPQKPHNWSINSKSKISSKYYQLKCSKSSHLNQVWVRLGMTHPEAKLLSICGPVELENKLPASRAQWRDKRSTVISIPKGSRWKEHRSYQFPVSSNPARKTPCSFQAEKDSLWSDALPSGPTGVPPASALPSGSAFLLP